MVVLIVDNSTVKLKGILNKIKNKFSTYLTTKSKWLKAKAMIPRNVDTALCTTGANMCCKLSMILRFLFPILVTKPCKEKKNQFNFGEFN